MLRGSSLLTAVLDGISRATDMLPPSADSRIEQTPDHWLNRSVSWAVEVGDLGAQMVVWEDGTAELDLVDMGTVDAHSEHLEINGPIEIELVTNKVLDWVVQ